MENLEKYRETYMEKGWLAFFLFLGDVGRRTSPFSKLLSHIFVLAGVISNYNGQILAAFICSIACCLQRLISTCVWMFTENLYEAVFRKFTRSCIADLLLRSVMIRYIPIAASIGRLLGCMHVRGLKLISWNCNCAFSAKRIWNSISGIQCCY